MWRLGFWDVVVVVVVGGVSTAVLPIQPQPQPTSRHGLVIKALVITKLQPTQPNQQNLPNGPTQSPPAQGRPAGLCGDVVLHHCWRRTQRRHHPLPVSGPPRTQPHHRHHPGSCGLQHLDCL